MCAWVCDRSFGAACRRARGYQWLDLLARRHCLVSSPMVVKMMIVVLYRVGE